MKKVFLKKARLAGAVMVATVGMTAGTVAQADSLLAPLVINGTGGYTTYFAMKMKGSQSFGAGGDKIHYTWIKKGSTLASLGLTKKVCKMENNEGKGSKGDMIIQDAGGNKNYYNGLPAMSGPAIPTGFDATTVNGYTAGPFVGMTVITDMANENQNPASGAPEGDFSGFAYIVNPGAQVVQDYKLLNNHHSAKDGDFGGGFISKHVVDFMWLGSQPTAGVAAPATGWTMSVTGPNMADHDNTNGGNYNSTYGLTVKVSQDTRSGEDDPQNAVAGAYDNDEVVISGDNPLMVTCMASFTHSAFLTPLQNNGTQWGGWTRKSIVPQTDKYAATNTAKIAKGAITYRADSWSIVPNWTTTMQVETGGHLAPNGNNHANRPY